METGSRPNKNIKRKSVEKRWLTAKEVGGYLALNSKTIYDYIARGLIPATKIGGSVRIDRRKLDEILEANSSISVAEQLKGGGG